MANLLFSGVRQMFVGQMLFYQIYIFVSVFTMFSIPIFLMLGKPVYILLAGALLILEYFAFDDWLNKSELKKHVSKEGKTFHDAKVFHSEFSQEMVIPISKISPLNARPIEIQIENTLDYQKAKYIVVNMDAAELEESDQAFDQYGIRKIEAKNRSPVPSLPENILTETEKNGKKEKKSIPMIQPPPQSESGDSNPVGVTDNTTEKNEEEEDIEESENQNATPSLHKMIEAKHQKLTTQLQNLDESMSRRKKKT